MKDAADKWAWGPANGMPPLRPAIRALRLTVRLQQGTKGDIEIARYEASVVIDRPVEEVCAYLNDVSNWAEWRPDVLEAEQTSEGPLGVGTTFRLGQQWMGRRHEATLEVTEYEPNSKLKYWGASGPGPAEHTYAFEPVEGGTRLTFVAEAEIGGFVKHIYGLGEPVFMRMAKRHMDGSFANLKDILEAQA